MTRPYRGSRSQSRCGNSSSVKNTLISAILDFSCQCSSGFRYQITESHKIAGCLNATSFFHVLTFHLE